MIKKTKKLTSDKNNETLGQRMARLRKEKGFSQVELAKKVGIIQTIVSEYERDNLRLHADTAVKLAKVLKVSSDELLGFTASNNLENKLSLKVLRRMIKIEALPLSQQKFLLRTIDTFLKGAKEI